MIDSTDRERLPVSKLELEKMLSNEVHITKDHFSNSRNIFINLRSPEFKKRFDLGVCEQERFEGK